MSYSEAMKYANEEEKGIEMEIYRREMEQQQYEDEMEEYIEDYIVDENTTFDSVLEEYYDYITDKFSFLV